MDAVIDLIKSLNSKLLIVAVSVLFLWIFAKAIRWMLNLLLIIALVFVVIWKVPTVRSFFMNFFN